MKSKHFRAMVVREVERGKFVREIVEKSRDELPAGDVLVRVRYSSLNYKDALSATGNRGVTRRYPHTPGIDAAGVVEESSNPRFHPGDDVFVTGFDLGADTDGGYAEYIRVPADWIVKPPENLTLRDSMVYGTAGFTAALSVHRLHEGGVTADHGEILVTGATGGVGSIAVGILAKCGYQVVASTGKLDREQFLMDLGAKEVVGRDDVRDSSGKPLLSGRWAGVVDTVGGDILATAIKSTKYGGVVTCCGLVASPELPITVFPFILRGVRLVGIQSSHCPMSVRMQMWRYLATDWKPDRLSDLVSECSLEELDREIERILHGKIAGRVVVNLSK